MKPDYKNKPHGKGWKWGLFRDANGHGESYYRWFRFGDARPSGFYLAEYAN